MLIAPSELLSATATTITRTHAAELPLELVCTDMHSRQVIDEAFAANDSPAPDRREALLSPDTYSVRIAQRQRHRHGSVGG
jgi:hypothetical protein